MRQGSQSCLITEQLVCRPLPCCPQQPCRKQQDAVDMLLLSLAGQHRPSFPQSSPSHMPKHCLLKLALDLYRVSTSEKFFFDATIDNGLRKHLHTQGNICPLWDFAIKSNCRWLGILTSPDLQNRSSGALLRQGGQGHPLCWSALSCDLQLPSPTSSTLSSPWQ